MIPASFEYAAPASIEEAIALLERHGDDAKVLAGGHSLIPLMKLRLADPKYLIDLSRIPGLTGVRVDGGAIAVGAMTTHAGVHGSSELRAQFPLLSEAAGAIGDVQVRNRGTLGGSLVHADPGGDLPAVAVAMNATMVARGPNGEREMNADEFFVGMLTSALEPNEVLTEVRFTPLTGRAGYAYQKAANKASGYAIVGVAAAVSLAEDGSIQDARIGVTGAGAQAVRATAAEDLLKGKQSSDALLSEAAALAASAIDDPLEDLHASGPYRLELVRVHTRRALIRAIAAAQ